MFPFIVLGFESSFIFKYFYMARAAELGEQFLNTEAMDFAEIIRRLNGQS